MAETHCHAIRHSALPHEDGRFAAYDAAHHQREVQDDGQDLLQSMEIRTPIRLGHDEAYDYISDFQRPLSLDLPGRSKPMPETDDNRSIDTDNEFLQVHMPTFSTGLTTFAYQRALRNRIRSDRITRHGEYDLQIYTATFFHDCLMLPGSLATVLGKVQNLTYDDLWIQLTLVLQASPADIIHRMTPGLLSGFHAHVHTETLQTCLLQSTDPTDYVQGMLIFGQGKSARKRIHKHYRPRARRAKVQVEIDIKVLEPDQDLDSPYQRWRLQRRKIWAHAWFWSNIGSGDVHFRTESPRWTLEDYLAGNLGPDQELRIEPTGMLEDEVEVDDSDFEIEQEKREIVRGGCGTLDYERAEYGFAGW